MRARVDLYLHGLFISKNFLGGKFHKNILPRDIYMVYYERNLNNIFGGNFMIFITIIASLIALNLIDNKITENENKMYDIIDNNENKEN